MSLFRRGPSQKEVAATLLHHAKAETLELFGPWWLEQRPVVKAHAEQAIAEYGERGMNLEHRVRTVQDCARALALEARLNAAIERAVTDKFPGDTKQLTRLLGDLYERDAATHSKWRVIVATHGIDTEALEHHFVS